MAAGAQPIKTVRKASPRETRRFLASASADDLRETGRIGAIDTRSVPRTLATMPPETVVSVAGALLSGYQASKSGLSVVCISERTGDDRTAS